MKFLIRPVISGKAMEFEVEKTETTKTTETYIVSSRGHSVTLQTNRLLFKVKGLKHRKGAWKVLAGEFKNIYAQEVITEAIEKYDPLKK